MEAIKVILQLTVALAIINVWVLRYRKATPWRGGEAKNMKEEFAAYGLPKWVLVFVGSLKVLFALLLVVGVWIQGLVPIAATGLSVLLMAAVFVHFRIRDPLKKSVPAVSIMTLSTAVLVL